MSRDERSVHIIRKVVFDCFLLGGCILIVLATQWVWSPFERGFFCGDQSLMFPYKPDTVSEPMLRIIEVTLPAIAFLICEWAHLRKQKENQKCLGISIPTWLQGFYCTGMSYALGAIYVELITNTAKLVIGRLRPHFFDLCRPSIDCNAPEWQNRYINTGDYYCTNEEQSSKFMNMRMSFLSGHSCMSAFSMIYLAFYLEKRITWRGTRSLRHSLQLGAILISWYIALSRVSDFKHHWSDVLAGYGVGVLFAVLVWTWGTDLLEKKKEHVPLPQNEMPITCNITVDTA